MRSKFTKSVMATTGLAIALIFSCSSDDGDDNSGKSSSGGGNNIVSSSSNPGGGGGSSSSNPNGINNYETVEIGSQTWLKYNMNVETTAGRGNSICYEGRDESIGTSGANISAAQGCAKFGRLYDWIGAMNLPSDCANNPCPSYINTPHRGICPEGFHIPTNAEWQTLINSVGGASTAGKHLKAQSGWKSCGPSDRAYSCLDDSRFSALPGGYKWSSPVAAGEQGLWWAANEISNKYNGPYWNIKYDGENITQNNRSKGDFLSVRCLKDKTVSSSSSGGNLTSSSSSGNTDDVIGSCAEQLKDGDFGFCLDNVSRTLCESFESEYVSVTFKTSECSTTEYPCCYLDDDSVRDFGPSFTKEQCLSQNGSMFNQAECAYLHSL